MKPERNWHPYEASRSNQEYCGQQDSLYNQPDNYNQRQQYFHDRTTKWFPYKTGYDKGGNEKMVVFILEYQPPI